MRVLIIAHGHPDLRAGGAERAAYSTFQQLKKAEGCTPTFVATTEPGAIGHDGVFGAFRGRPDEWLWAPPPIDGFRLTSQRYDALREQCQELIEAVRPDVIHVHHYVHLGVEVFPILRELAPAATQVLTLHEYILICNYFGQMVKAQSKALCHTSSHAECAQCFPDISSGQFFLRKRLLQQCLEAVDQFVAPSHFLKQRFTDWGLAPGRIAVIENFLPDHLTIPAEASTPHAPGRVRVGFFGQHNPFKGADVLLDALANLSEDALDSIEVVMFGANLELQPEDYRARIERLQDNVKGRISWFGGYRNEDVIALMRGVDWIVVPSIWWENSPLVIQEAKAAGRPVLCSNIGGMREKVEDGVTGLHFRVGNAFDLASKLEQIAAGAVRLEVPPADIAQHNASCLDAHIALYAKPRGQKVAAYVAEAASQPSAP